MYYNALYVNEIHKQNLSSEYKLHKSYRHHDNELCFGGGWFIVTMQLPTGSISNHYRNEFWDLFNIPVEEKSTFEFDGHTPEIAAERMLEFIQKNKVYK
jgi:hypothetical protein